MEDDLQGVSSASEVFKTVIPRSVRLAEAPSFGKTILAYDPRSAAPKLIFNLQRKFWRMSKEPDRNPRKALGKGLSALLPA